ncbi:hypothetical protein GCM10025869_30660 [Homoserinibacter gongjuensis]|uniref:Uncharacterized protein n=1 Tax=Homoserinibacter gongjuensis TaxID=1162968 RepID=A0ABQ6K0T9_9MICO|nr:hypothetical protein GCM10025869_30660 [Homoserinibacter gongjuensis]
MGGLLDRQAVHDRVGVREPELDRVEAVLDEGDGGVDRRLQIGEADREVADEPLALREGGADTGVRPGGR